MSATTINYTTSGGSQITLTHVTSRGLAADHTMTEACDYITMSINGGHAHSPLTIGEHASGVTVIRGTIGGIPAVVLPTDDATRQQVLDLFAGVRSRAIAEVERIVAVDSRATKAHRQALHNGLCPRCHTYCDGDCTASN